MAEPLSLSVYQDGTSFSWMVMEVFDDDTDRLVAEGDRLPFLVEAITAAEAAAEEENARREEARTR
jgi:hypothetical protein